MIQRADVNLLQVYNNNVLYHVKAEALAFSMIPISKYFKNGNLIRFVKSKMHACSDHSEIEQSRDNLGYTYYMNLQGPFVCVSVCL